jgi:hypothetical protein
MAQFTRPEGRFYLGSVDDTTLGVTAQYNPSQLEYDRAVPWQNHQEHDLEFDGWQGRTVTVELLFDGVEERRSIAPEIAILETLATVRNPGSKYEAELRPHHCTSKFGDEPGVPRFDCVITNLTVKYTYFSPKGLPLRATATVKLKEANVLKVASKKR